MPVTISLFFDRLRASEVLEQEQFEALWQRIPLEKRDLPAERLAPKLVEAKKLTQYQASALLNGNSDPLLLGDYIILERIGSGGMGQVYKARHRHMKRTTALKVLPADAMRSPDAVKRFQREVQAAARLLHTNIVTAFDAGQSSGVHFLVMEYVDGQDLAAISKAKGQLPIEQAVDYMLQAARGLVYAHSQGVVHRDIKPANLLVDSDGTVKILDMGLARVEANAGMANRGVQEQLTQSGQVMGTLDFMAPEQAFDTRSADARSDIYSLGCTLYRLLTGETMFAGESMVQIILAHREQPVPSMREKRPEIPAALDAIFQKMVAKTPEQRQASMTDVVSALEGFARGPAAGAASPAEPDSQRGDDAQGGKTKARPSPRQAAGSSVGAGVAVAAPAVKRGSTARLAQSADDTSSPNSNVLDSSPSLSDLNLVTDRSSKSSKSNKPAPSTKSTKSSKSTANAGVSEAAPGRPRLVLMIGGAAACVLLLAGVAIALFMWNRAGSTKKSGDPVVTPKKGSPDKPKKKTSTAAVVAKKLPPLPAGQPAGNLFGLLLDPPKIPGLGRWQVDTNAPRAPVVVVAWSPDNRFLAVGSIAGEVRIYNTETWRLAKVLVGHTSLVRALAWSPDGSRIASASDDKTVRLWRPDGTPGPLLPGFIKPACLAWSPDGQWFVVGDSENSALHLYPSDGTTSTPLAGHTGGIWSVAWHPESKQFVSCSQDKTLQLWNASGMPDRSITGHDSPLRSVSWSRSGQIAAVDSAGAVYVYAAERGSPQVFSKLGAISVAWSPDGSKLAVGLASSIQLWDDHCVPSGEQHVVPGGLTHLAWSLDGKRIAWAGLNVGVWEPGGAASGVYAASPVVALDWHPNGGRFVAAHADGRLRWWRSDGTLEEASSPTTLAPTTLTWSPSGQLVAGSGGKDLYLWTADRQTRPAFNPKTSIIHGLAWSPSGEQLAVVGNTLSPQLWDTSGNAVATLTGHTKKLVTHVDWSASTGQIATASNDGTIRLWSADGTPGLVIDAPLVGALKWSPDGKELAVAFAANKDPRIKLFDADGSASREINGGSDLRALAWSASSERLAGGDRAGNLLIWRRTGEAETSLKQHAGEIRALAWSKNGLIVTAGDDGALRCWDDAAGKSLWVALAHADGDAVSIGPAGRPVGSLVTAEKTLVYLVERESGRLDLLPPLAFQRLQ